MDIIAFKRARNMFDEIIRLTKVLDDIKTTIDALKEYSSDAVCIDVCGIKISGLSNDAAIAGLESMNEFVIFMLDEIKMQFEGL